LLIECAQSEGEIFWKCVLHFIHTRRPLVITGL
jgi:hypothetical protein